MIRGALTADVLHTNARTANCPATRQVAPRFPEWTDPEAHHRAERVAEEPADCTRDKCLRQEQPEDLKRAHAVSNPQLSPHLEFVDMGGHGYATVRLTSDEMRTEFVCIPRPITRSDYPDGGPLRYRVVHTASLVQSPARLVWMMFGEAGYGAAPRYHTNTYEAPCRTWPFVVV